MLIGFEAIFENENGAVDAIMQVGDDGVICIGAGEGTKAGADTFDSIGCTVFDCLYYWL